MNCKEFVDFLMDYLEGGLPPEQASAFEKHLHLCPPCVHYLESYKECVELGRACCACDDDEVSSEVPEQLIQAILSARNASPDAAGD